MELMPLPTRGFGYVQQTSHKRIGQRSAWNRRTGRSRRLSEVDIRGGFRPASEIARARTDAAAARSIEKTVAGAEHRIRQEAPRQAHARPPILVGIAGIRCEGVVLTKRARRPR